MSKFTKKRVLIFPSGMENGIEIGKSLKFCKEVEVFSATANVQNQAFYLYSANNIVRHVNEDGWVNDLNSAIDKHSIDIVYPANSLVIDALNDNRKNIRADILLPSEAIIDLTRSKKKTLNTLMDLIDVPKVYEFVDDIPEFPVFIKPDRGYGAQGASIIYLASELDSIELNDFIIQELLPGKEYTIDCFSDSNGRLVFCSGRERSRIRMATSMHAEDISDELNESFREIAGKILSRIPIEGVWFFQMKEDAVGKLKLLEIDVRIAGTMAFNRCKGVNFPLLSLYQYYGHDVGVLTNDIRFSMDRCLKNRYVVDYHYDTVYVDLDDTIIIKGKLNLELITFLYQCINKKIKIVLVSKNLREDKEQYLIEHKIYQLFDEIIWLEESDKKYRYMKNQNAIFIDDSYSQRKETAEILGIPTFDCSMVEALLDDRE
ncbi:ATP-grasp domain-containing protein [Aeromonas allosaccharophila]